MNHTRAVSPTTFSKPPRLIEATTDDPIRVIQEVFRCAFVEDLRDNFLPKWLRTALINENSIYTNTEHRTQLLEFYDHLILFTEAMQVFSENQKQRNNNVPESEPDEGRLPLLLTAEQISNPLQVVSDFHRQFTRDYVRRELWYFLEAGVTHSGDYPSGFAPGYALMAYDFVSCLTEASYGLSKEQ